MTTYLDQTGLERLVANIKANFTTSAQVDTAIDTKISNKADKANTIAGYGITDAKISNGVITLGSATITPLTSHQSLDNYYTKTEVDSKVSAIPKFAISVVAALPTSDISNTTIYLLKTGSETDNLYTEYIYVNSKWETLGTQKMDLSGYLTKTDASNTYLGKTAAAVSANKLNTDAGSATQPIYFSNGKPVATTYTLGASVPSGAKFTDTVYTHPATHPASMITGLASVATSGSYNDLTDKPTIPASSTVDSELSSTSVNPVQNKVINAALNNKADSSALSGYLPLTGGTCTGNVSAPSFQTGTGTTNYFQCQKFRSEGDSSSYYHAIDFGYAGHDSVDFYEYDANWKFYSCTTGKKSQAVLVGNINSNGWNGGAKLTGAPTAPTATTGTNSTQIATTAFVQNSLNGYVKSVNNATPDINGNVTITAGTDVTVDDTLSATSTNAIQNKAVYNALLDKVGTDIYSGFSLIGAATTIAWRQGSQPVGSINASSYTGNAASATKATQDGEGNVISSTYIKTVNNVKPDSSGNVNITASGGVSTSKANTWTALQTFHDLMLRREKYATVVSASYSDTPTTSTVVYMVTGAFSLNLSTLAGALSASQSSVFTAYFIAGANYSLTILNAGELKYIGSASDIAITSTGLLLNIFMTKNASGTLTSIVQANKLT